MTTSISLANPPVVKSVDVGEISFDPSDEHEDNVAIIIGGSVAQSHAPLSTDDPKFFLPLVLAISVSCCEITKKSLNLQGQRRKGQKRTCKIAFFRLILPPKIKISAHNDTTFRKNAYLCAVVS